MSGTPAALPALVTIPGVDLIATGTWELSSGRQTFTSDDLTQAIEASKCPAVGDPIIKLGHTDPRFNDGDGQPAIGKITNLVINDSHSKLVGDMTGMPGWLGAISASAFPRRSVEGTYNFKCQIGHTHPFVLTGVALLGVAAPGVGVLNDLTDIASLYGVQAAQTAAQEMARSWRFTSDNLEGPALALTEEDVRRAYYATSPDYSWWITELQMTPTQLIVTDGSKVYRVPFQVADADNIHFDAAVELASYAEVAASRGTGAVVTYATADESRNVAADGNNGWIARNGKWVYDPDNDGDNDATAEGDTDHSHFGTDGKMKSGVKIPPMPTGSPVDATSEPDYQVHLDAVVAADTKTPPKPYGDVKYADPKNGKYPIDSKERANAAWDYINKPKNAGMYPLNGVSLQSVKDAIMAACKQFGIKISADAADPPTLNGDNESGNMNNDAMTHGPFSGTHSHIHAANGSQGGDATHTHSHTHSGDANHSHAHAAAGGKEGSEVEFTDEQKISLRKRLGLDEGAELTPEVLITATVALGETADQKVAAAAKRQVPAGVVQVEQEVWDNLNRKVEASARFQAKVLRDERDEVIDKAIRDGKFSAARKTHWTRLWDSDPDGTREVLGTLKKNVVPVDDIGAGGGNLDDEAYEQEFAGLYPPGTFKK